MIILNIGLFYLHGNTELDNFEILYNNILWLVISYFTGIYSFNRYTKVPRILRNLFYQYAVFTLANISYFALVDRILNARQQITFLLCTFILITIFRTLYFYGLRRYRIGGRNFRNVVIIGSNKSVDSLIGFFNNRTDFGYRFKGYFDDQKTNKPNFLGTIENSFNYIIDNSIDEIYCSVSTLTQKQINQFINFADNNVKVIKLIPDSKNIYSKMTLEYYGYLPVMSIRKLPFDNPIVKALKRLFDIIFSLLVIISILSWLTPILFILIKMESKGSLFFKQIREGIKGKPFQCYKFRSMGINNLADKIQATKNDVRVTKIGSFLRKTSIDELPQFFNVLKGDMSVVGPRPHMLSQSEIFKTIVDKYMVRHFVKPGITGLAQVRGFRGEIIKDSDIINRVKFDIFYIENWSFFLDAKIILLTLINVFKGEEKAY